MRFIGRHVSKGLRGISVGVAALLATVWIAPANGQTTAPQVLPYTMSTFAGPAGGTGYLTIGQKCGNYVALDIVGSGCPAQYITLDDDPHDIRVDAKGNVYWVGNNTANGMVRKISAETGLASMFIGSSAQKKACTTGDKYGDGCIANDGVANSGTATYYTCCLAKSRGIGVAANGDLFLADYGGNEVHKVSAATNVFSVIAGTGTSGDYDGAVGSSLVSGARGVGVDSNTGNVYVADTANNVIRMITPGGVTSTITAQYASSAGLGSSGCTTARVINSNAAPVPAASAFMCAPEDAQVDSNSNIFIADAGDNLVRVISGSNQVFFGITMLKGYVYTVAGFNINVPGAPAAATAYPTGGATPSPTVVSTTLSMGIRKIGVDAQSNLYVADATNNVIWFVDSKTGYARLIAGNAGATAGAANGIGCANSVDGGYGDGCPGPLASIYSSAGSDAANSPDNLGNLYLTDSEGANAPITARLRKVLSGLNFGTVYNASATTAGVAAGSSLTQNVFVHFGPLDSAALANAFVISNPDFVVTSNGCQTTPNADTTSDCILSIKFTPSKAGFETALLTVTSKLGAASSFQLTGTGLVAAVAIDPGNTTLLAPPTAPNNPQGVFVDAAGNAYVADTANNRVLLYTAATSTWTTIAGTGVANYTGDGGPATAATLKSPKAVTMDSTGAIYIADSGNNVVRRVSAAGIISTFAGGTVCSAAVDALGDECPATQAKFSNPSGLAADSLGQIYVSDTGDNVIRQINVLGNVSLIAGGATTVCGTNTDTFGDGCAGVLTQFNGPTALAYDATGKYLIVADSGDNVVRRVYLGTTFSTTGTGTLTLASSIQVNGVSLVAGNGQTGGSVASSGLATASSISGPTGVAVDANENVYIADTGDGAIRLVTASTGIISTVMGINGTPGSTAITSGISATSTQLLTPASVAVTPTGLLYVADSGNNRILTDSRSQVSYNFGRTNDGFMSPVQVFTETNIGTVAANLSTTGPLYTASGNTTVFTLTGTGNSTSCPTTSTSPITLAVGAQCTLQGQFIPTTTGNFSATYTETGASTTPVPAITLVGIGAVLTNTTSTVAQTTPATGNSQFGGSLTVTATVTPASCNSAAPSCYPTGTVRFVVDGVQGGPVALSGTNPDTASQSVSGLSVGPHTISCNYSGDNYYASSTCMTVTVTVAQASTTSLLSASPNNQPQYPTTACVPSTAYPGDTQCNTTTLVATVVSNTSGQPTGTVTFLANGTAIGTASLNSTTGVATLVLSYTRDANYNLVADTTLAPGTYTLTCAYNGAANYAASNCAAVTFTVVGSAPSFTLATRGCSAVELVPTGGQSAGEGTNCGAASTGVPEYVVDTAVSTTCVLTNPAGAPPVPYGVYSPCIGTAQGSTADATIFINPTNTVSGTLTFSCSGLPQYSICTFSPTSITLKAGTAFPATVYTDVTMWTDINPKNVTSLSAPSIGGGKHGVALAMIVGWPLTLLGFVGMIGLRRKKGTMRALTLLALVLVMCGSTLIFSGCAGPGDYVPVLTPASTGNGYPVTVTVSGGGVSQSVVVYFKVSAPGLPNQE